MARLHGFIWREVLSCRMLLVSRFRRSLFSRPDYATPMLAHAVVWVLGLFIHSQLPFSAVSFCDLLNLTWDIG